MIIWVTIYALQQFQWTEVDGTYGFQMAYVTTSITMNYASLTEEIAVGLMSSKNFVHIVNVYVISLIFFCSLHGQRLKTKCLKNDAD